ncbi:mortality factor 4-like protein 1 isoform X2 [Babylonia areolata]|uniref:mortality factor 4-like protein 1 isoform X2 n=1 Tax=Babylonia areolata TaxID=304850 RepID=UPI003FD58CBC
MPPKTKFHEGEKVLCFHGPLLYEAKCVRVDVKDKQTRYYIHYNGWNKNWDEWVPESRVLKHNEAGLQKQKELMNAHGYGAVKKASKGGRKAEKKEVEKKEEKEKPEKEEKEKEKEKKGSSASQAASKKKEEKASPAAATVSATLSTSVAASERSSAASSPAPEPKRKRPRIDPTTVESEEVFMSRIEVKIKMPDELKPWLVDDWDLITRQKMLVNLPCKNNVDSILEDYVKSKTAKSNANKDAIIETMAGVKDYFNVMLGTQLLYKFERPQYSEVTTENPDKPMSALYGATHLLRLFVRLGQMLAYTSLDEKCVQILLTHIHDFLKYMLKNSSSLFSHADYSIAPPEYHRKAI